MNEKPTVALTIGDPAGVGPEVVIKALADESVTCLARWIVVGDAWVIRQAEALTGLGMPSPDAARPRSRSRAEGGAGLIVVDLFERLAGQAREARQRPARDDTLPFS